MDGIHAEGRIPKPVQAEQNPAKKHDSRNNIQKDLKIKYRCCIEMNSFPCSVFNKYHVANSILIYTINKLKP